MPVRINGYPIQVCFRFRLGTARELQKFEKVFLKIHLPTHLSRTQILITSNGFDIHKDVVAHEAYLLVHVPVYSECDVGVFSAEHKSIIQID